MRIKTEFHDRNGNRYFASDEIWACRECCFADGNGVPMPICVELRRINNRPSCSATTFRDKREPGIIWKADLPAPPQACT